VREEHGDAEQEAVETAGTSHPFLKHPLKRGRMPDHETLKKPTKRTKYDPVRLIRSVDFQHYLRDEDQFSKALDKAKKVDEDPSDDDVQPRDASKDASKSTRQRARHRLDVLNMLLERREFEEWLAADVLESIHVHADASPVVGVELQGQLLDFCFKDGDVKQRVLPGAELPYGMTGAVSKACTLLWGMFLTLGPRKEQLRTALSLVASFTTDNGTEVGLLKLPDILDAFYLWMGGMPIGDLESHVVQGSRLFQEAIRVIGFGHTCGSIMSSVANSYKYWPEIIGQIRTLVHFFRNESYRTHLQLVLKGRCDTKCLDHFQASFLKWRFETLAVAVQELVPLREVCGHLREEQFPDIQDKVELRKVVAAAGDQRLWRWICGPGRRVLVRIEGIRHWSMVCGCPEHVRERREHPGRSLHCVRNGRRIHEVRKFVTEEIRKARDDATHMTPDMFEGDRALCVATRQMMQKYASLLGTRTKYFSLIPGCFLKRTTRQWRLIS